MLSEARLLASAVANLYESALITVVAECVTGTTISFPSEKAVFIVAFSVANVVLSQRSGCPRSNGQKTQRMKGSPNAPWSSKLCRCRRH